jgi:hypothetical protein
LLATIAFVAGARADEFTITRSLGVHSRGRFKVVALTVDAGRRSHLTKRL